MIIINSSPKNIIRTVASEAHSFRNISPFRVRGVSSRIFAVNLFLHFVTNTKWQQFVYYYSLVCALCVELMDVRIFLARRHHPEMR